jgi:hypothetical protein
MLVTLLAALIGLVVGIGVAWLILSGVLAMTFRRARGMIRRMIERRGEARPGNERRAAERRGR